MRKKIFAAMIVAVIAMFAGYNMYQSQRAESTMSNLALANVEALADEEVMGGNCEGSTSKECCVCDTKHYIYAAVVNERYCESRSGCTHFDDPNDR